MKLQHLKIVDFKRRKFLITFIFCVFNSYAFSQISGVWANTGEDKVTQDDLRLFSGKNVINSVWDGNTVKLFGAKNEVVSFNLVLEAGNIDATKVNVELEKLTSNNQYELRSKKNSGSGLFNWVDREIELFFIRYLEIKGLSTLSYESYYDERHAPERLRRPFDKSTGKAIEGTDWYDRPDHNKKYPDIAVPIELHPDFSISAKMNQSIWFDIYIPKDAPSGEYYGNILITESGSLTFTIPVVLSVLNFSLPEEPTSKTMMNIGYEYICERYTGNKYPLGGSVEDIISKVVRLRHMQLAHRHKISFIDYNYDGFSTEADQPLDYWISALDGTLFSEAKGYNGPGEGVGNSVFSIGTFGTWTWDGKKKKEVYEHTDKWVNWFNDNFPKTDYMLFLIDEPDEDSYDELENLCEIIKSNTGAGGKLPVFLTVDFVNTQKYIPSADISGTAFGFGDSDTWETAFKNLTENTSKRYIFYNGFRPTQGSFVIEDDGIALRVIPWAQFKMNIERWFLWESTFYNNDDRTGQTNVFTTAQTYGVNDGFDQIFGETGYNYNNGDGVLFYPGTDKIFPSESYNIPGPFASLRLKHWRRGIQDADYLKLASQVNPSAVDEIVKKIIPKVFWEYGVAEKEDPTWQNTDISWSTNPDTWESARRELADIIINPVGNYEISRKKNRVPVYCYPNPTEGIINFNISPDFLNSDIFLSIYNITGRKVFSSIIQNENNNSNNFNFNTLFLEQGVYLYEISYDKFVFKGRFIKI